MPTKKNKVIKIEPMTDADYSAIQAIAYHTKRTGELIEKLSPEAKANVMTFSVSFETSIFNLEIYSELMEGLLNAYDIDKNEQAPPVSTETESP